MIALIQFINHFSTLALAALINTVPIAMVLAAIVWLALRFMRANAATRHTAWWAVLAAIALLPLIPRSAPNLLLPAIKPKSTAIAPKVGARVLETCVSDVASLTCAPGSNAPIREKILSLPSRGVPPASESSTTRSPALIVSAAPVAQSRRFSFPFELHAGNFPAVLFAIWLAVFSMLFTRIILSYEHVRRLRNRAALPSPELARRFALCLKHAQMKSQPRLLVSSDIASPLAAGFLHPVVIVPDRLLANVSAAELDNVLLHELAHFARRDHWTNLLARLAACVAILHPVAAFALSRIEREREIACDDWAIAVSGSARQYAATLAHLFEVCGTRRRELLATGMAHRSSRLGERIELVLRPKREFAARTSLARLALCTVAGLAILIAAAQTPRWIAFAQNAQASPLPPVPPAAPAKPAAHTPPTPQATAVPPVAGIEPIRPAEPSGPGLNTPIPATPPAQPNPPVAAPPQLAATDTVPPMEPAPAAEPIPSTPVALAAHQGLYKQDWSGWQPEWSIDHGRNGSSNQIHFTFGYRQGTSQIIESSDVNLSTLRDFSPAMLDRDGPIKFEYVRDAGSLICEGQVRNGRAYGTFTISPNQEFVSALEKMGYPAPEDHDLVSLMMSNVTLGFARDVKSTGLDATIGDLGELRGHDVTADYIRQARQAGLTQLTVDDFCELRTHGVEPQYLQRMLAADPKLSADDIAELRTHGVEPDYLKGMLATGQSLSMEEISELRTHGVEPNYFQSMHAANPKLSIDDITELRTHGAEPEYVRGIESADPQLTPEEISQLRTHSVEPEYLKGILATGIHLTIDEICELRTHGVEPQYLKGIAAAGPNLTAEEISDLRMHGVEPDYYKGMKTVDPRLTIDDITNLRTHGVEPDYYKQCKAVDPKLTVDEITNLRTHGVDPSHIKELRSTIPGMSVDEMIGLSQHGVPASFVAETTREGYHFTANELSELWNHGVDAAYLRNLQEMGMKNLTASQILKLRGVS